MKIKKNDTVKILTGKDKGKTGKVLKVLKSTLSATQDRLIVEGLNLKYKHTRAKRENEKGQRIMFPAAIHNSNLALVCPKCNKATRVTYKINQTKEKGTQSTKDRVCKKCNNII